MPITRAATQTFADAVAADLGDTDIMGVLTQLRRDSGL
jgi:hypothetical protein